MTRDGSTRMPLTWPTGFTTSCRQARSRNWARQLSCKRAHRSMSVWCVIGLSNCSSTTFRQRPSSVGASSRSPERADTEERSLTHVVMLVANDVSTDSRVKKEALAVARTGLSVTVVGLDGGQSAYEESLLGPVRDDPSTCFVHIARQPSTQEGPTAAGTSAVLLVSVRRRPRRRGDSTAVAATSRPRRHRAGGLPPASSFAQPRPGLPRRRRVGPVATAGARGSSRGHPRPLRSRTSGQCRAEVELAGLRRCREQDRHRSPLEFPAARGLRPGAGVGTRHRRTTARRDPCARHAGRGCRG